MMQHDGVIVDGSPRRSTSLAVLSGTTGDGNADEQSLPRYRSVLEALGAAGARDAVTGITLLPERDDGPPRHLSYRGLGHAAQRVAGDLAAFGIAPGDRVLLVFPTSLEFITAFMAVQLIGAIPVPAYPPTGLRLEAGLDRLAHIARHAGVTAILTVDALRIVCGDVAMRARCVRAVEVVTVGDVRAEPMAIPQLSAAPRTDDPAFIQFTSGSTSQPKGVLLSHGNLLSNMHASGVASGVSEHDTTVSWLPLYHDMGLIGAVLFPMYWQMPLVLMSPTAFLRRPIRWLRALHEYRGTLSPAPNFAFRLCTSRVTAADREGLDLSAWRVAYNGSEPVNLQTLREFERVYASHGYAPTTSFPVYGLAECSLAVTFPAPGTVVRHESVDRTQLGMGYAVPRTDEQGLAIVSVGRPIPYHDIRILDATGRGGICEERTIGEVIVRGPSVMQGYFRDPEATRNAVRDGWLYTGDLGYVADGELFIVGRAKDLLIIRGRNIHPEDLEHTAESLTGVRGGGCIAFGQYDERAAEDRVVLVCETTVGDAAERATLAGRVKLVVGERHDVTVHHVEFVAPGTIPKTSSGKRQRAQCRALFERGELNRPRPGAIRRLLVTARGSVGLRVIRARRWLAR